MTEAMSLYNLDKAYLSQKAAESGFVRDTLEKVYRLADVLSFIYSDAALSENLVLKGGTAINLTVFNLPRLSVDIDLDFDRRCGKDDMLAIREEIGNRLLRYMQASGYAPSGKQKDAHALASWVFRYQSSAGNHDNIKIEINYSMRQHILPAREACVDIDVLGAPIPVRTLAPVELFGSKIKALTERGAARDLYDVHNMIRMGLFDESERDLLRKCVLFYRAVGSTGKFQEEINLDGVDRLSQHTILQDLVPVLRKGAKTELEAMRAEVKSFASELLVPNQREQMFLREFAEGIYEPSLLFDDADILERISDHPMAIWKCEKIRQTQNAEQTVQTEHKADGPSLTMSM